MAWDPPSNTDLISGAVGLSQHLKDIRDLPAAMAARATDAPWLNGIGEQVVFTASGSWTVPAGVNRIRATLIGGGGAGGAGQDTNPSTGSRGDGGGGGAGCFAVHTELPTTPGESLTITVGAGGAGGTGAGGAGGTTTVSTAVGLWVSVSALGGSGGGLGASSRGAGGAGGAPSTAADLPGEAGNAAHPVGPGQGAQSVFGGASPPLTSGLGSVVDALPSYVWGAGGSGGSAISAGLLTKNGGDGAPGVVIIDY